jgi:hypothetical protein
MIPLYDTTISSSENGKLGFPAHVKVEKIVLFSSVDKKTAAKYAQDESAHDMSVGYLISESVSELSFVESLYSITVSGTITIIDNFSFFQDARIHGQEMLLMKFRRFSPETQAYDFTFFREFYVTSVLRFEREEFRAVMTLEFISPHSMADRFARISRAYGYTDLADTVFHPNDISGGREMYEAWKEKYKDITIDYYDPGILIGAPSDVGKEYVGVITQPMEMPEQFVYHILVTDLKIPRERVFLYGYHPEDGAGDDHSHSRMKLVVPGWRPIQTIRWLMRAIFSKNGDPWFCYETFWGGIRIEPYSTLIASDDELNDGQKWSTGRPTKVLDREFIYNYLFVPDPKTKEYFTDVHRKILDLNIGYSFDQHLKFSNGAYSSHEWYVDIASKFVIPNDLIPIEATLLKYDETIDEESWLREQFRPFTAEVEKFNPPQHAPDPQETNYTYYVPYNTALHGITEDTFPYNSAFGLNSLHVSTIEVPGGQQPAPREQNPNITPDPNCPFTRSSFNKDDPRWHAYLLSKEKQYGLPCGYLWGIMMTESRGNPNAVSPAGAKGLFQFIPSTAIQFKLADPFDPCTSADAAARHLIYNKRIIGTDDWEIIAMAYNSGPGKKVYKQIARGEVPRSTRTGLKRETIEYGPKVMSAMKTAPYCSGATKPIEDDSKPKTSDTGTTKDFQDDDPSKVVSFTSQIDGIDLGRYGRTGEMKKKNMDFIQHQMTVYGDFRLNPGAILNISVQRTADPQLIPKIEGLRETDPIEDKYLSGEYFVIDAKHFFNADGFFTKATISRPSSSISLEN